MRRQQQQQQHIGESCMMGPVPVVLYFWAVNPGRCFLCLYNTLFFYFILFDCCPPFLLLSCVSVCRILCPCPYCVPACLHDGMACIPLLTGRLSFLRSLLTRMFFLPYAYYVVVLCLFVSHVFVFVCLFFLFLVVYLILCAILATM